jgi:hypothetical protein
VPTEIFAIVNSTLSIPLNTSWTNTTLNMTEIGKVAPVLARGVMWTDQARQLIYMWGDVGGALSPDHNDTHTWALSADGTGGGAWKFENLESPSQMQRASGGAATTCYNTGFNLGGQTTPANASQVLVPGLLTYNMSSNIWSNESATSFTTLGTSVGAEAVCLPDFGPSGLVLFLGGVTSVVNNWFDPLDALFHSPGVAFDNLTVYDPFTREWYWQTTTGNRPTPRHEFCAVGVRGPQNTYEMYRSPYPILGNARG